MLLLVITSKSAGFPLLHKFLQFPLPNEFFYLLLQVSTILSVIAMVLIEMVVFLLVTHIR